MSDRTALPQFLIIGAIKAATTWLTWQLQRQPDIFLPEPEPHYFSREFHRGPAWYARIFEGAAPGQLRGEKTADYLANPDAAARIAQVLPDIPMIVQLRDPIDRAYSDYCMLLRRGTISGGPDEYLNPATATFRRFLDNGCYHAHLQRWFELFDRKQFLIFLLDDVKDRPAEVLDDCRRHIGAPPLDKQIVPVCERINDGSLAFLPLTMRRLLAPAKPLIAPFRGNRLFERTRATLARTIDYPPLSPELRARLRDYYAPEIAKLSALLGRSLDHWCPPARIAA